MTAELRKTGIGIVGDIPWGTHFCSFHETKEDLLDILVEAQHTLRRQYRKNPCRHFFLD